MISLLFRKVCTGGAACWARACWTHTLVAVAAMNDKARNCARIGFPPVINVVPQGDGYTRLTICSAGGAPAKPGNGMAIFQSGTLRRHIAIALP
jgi:hypothetical protein